VWTVRRASGGNAFKSTQPALHWVAVCVALVSLALGLSPPLYSSGPVYEELILLILLFVAVAAIAVAALSPVTRPMAAFTAVLLAVPCVPYGVSLAYRVGMHIPLFFQNAAIVWPQLVFFGGTLWSVPEAQGPVLPQNWAGVITIAFWAIVAFAFSRITLRLSSFVVLVGLSAATIMAMGFAIQALLPFLKWRLLLDFP
jgi:hypothetical protein